MENDILDSLEDLGYEGPLSEEGVLEKALNDGPRSIHYTQLVEWITKELKDFTGLEDSVSAINDPSDVETFLMELSGFLREFGCPYTELSEGPISQRLNTKNRCLCLLDYLLTELQALRMLAVNRPDQTQKAVEMEKDNESEIARYMKGMLIALNFPKPPPGITAFQLFSKVESKIKELLNSIQSAHMSKPLLKARLSNKQWEKVNFINSAMRQEYECRRDMLLKRLDVTIQSFNWSDRAKGQEDKLVALYQPVRRALSSKVETEIAHLLAAREDLLRIEKTSSGIAREKTKTDLNRVLIGKVPDRGGRAYEHDIPPPEMPSFMQRQQQPQQQRQGWSGGHRGKRGGGSFWQSKKRGRYQ